MATALKEFLEHLPRLGAGLTDSQLLGRFIATRDEASFAALVCRHGPMVLGVCRRVLRNPQDVEDAFQATFLILAQKAGAVVKRESLASWLYGVAYHAALRARTVRARRRAAEKQVEETPHPVVRSPEEPDWLPLLDQELSRLPEKYRTAIVICELEGRSRKEAARLLGVPEGTLSSRLAMGRRLLAKRLARSGLTLAGATAIAGVPSALADSTVRTACGQLAASTTAVLLTNEVMKTMLLKKLRLAVGGVLVMVTLGVVGLGYQAGHNPAVAQTARPNEVEALRKEVELLRLNLLVVLEKVRAQEAELRAMRTPTSGGNSPMSSGGGDGRAEGMPGMMRRGGGGESLPGPEGMGMPGGANRGRGLPGGSSGDVGSPDGRIPTPVETPPGGRTAPGGETRQPGYGSVGGVREGPFLGEVGAPDPVLEAERAVKALREAKDKDAKRRATEALEKAMKKLKENSPSRGGPSTPAP